MNESIIKRIVNEVYSWKKPLPCFEEDLSPEEYNVFCRGAVLMSEAYKERLFDILKDTEEIKKYKNG